MTAWLVAMALYALGTALMGSVLGEIVEPGAPPMTRTQAIVTVVAWPAIVVIALIGVVADLARASVRSA